MRAWERAKKGLERELERELDGEFKHLMSIRNGGAMPCRGLFDN